MTVDPVALWCGPVSLTESELRDRMRRDSAARTHAPHSLVAIFDDDRVNSVVTALAVRANGAIPLLGDDRWTPEYRAQLRMLATAAAEYREIAWAAFSSGSSGSPRVILRSEASWSACFDAVSALMRLESSDAVFLPAPLSSSLSLFSVAHSRSIGAAVVLPSTQGFSLADLDHATAIHGTPRSLQVIVESLESASSSHGVRVALIGGAHLEPGLRHRAEALGIRVVSYYGAAELSFVTVDTDGLGHRAFPGVDVRVEAGELWARSPYLASGYLGEGGALRYAPGGWATVGDRVEVDSAGRMHFRGRSDGAIITAAATVVPEDVESALRSIDGVEDAIVFGLANATVGALVCVLIETTPGQVAPSLSELREQARSRLAPSHLPRRWYRIDALPRTSSGKPARAEARRAIENGEVTRLD
ncbi:class I adenylate-forming enzyme family protein [Lacisediminihabitans sp. FW035]